MTTIIAIESHDGVYMIADRCATIAGGRPETLRESKVFKAGEALIGVSGTLRALQVLKLALRPRERRSDETPLQYVAGAIVSDVRLALMEYAANREDAQDMIVAVAGQLFVVGSDDSVCATNRGCDAIGSGERFALGVLHDTRKVRDPKLRLWRAMEAAAEFDSSTAAPFEFFFQARPQQVKAE